MLLRGGHKDVGGRCWLFGDWRTERRLLMEEQGEQLWLPRTNTETERHCAHPGQSGHRRLNDSEPQPRATTPRCPDHLDALAKKEWKRLVPVLRRMKVLTEADGMTLANLCQAWSTLVKAQEKLTEMGILYKTPNGYIQQSPLFS